MFCFLAVRKIDDNLNLARVTLEHVTEQDPVSENFNLNNLLVDWEIDNPVENMLKGLFTTQLFLHQKQQYSNRHTHKQKTQTNKP